MERNLFWGVKAPNKKIYLIDGHHKVRSLMNLGLESLPITIVDDLSNLSEHHFWETMITNKWIYLKNHHGEELSSSELPHSFKELKNDPYRSLAWFIRKNKIYKKDGKPFQEFEWANFLRKNLSGIEITSLEDIRQNSDHILNLIYSPPALELRGHQGDGDKQEYLDTNIY